jgi:hypothetical protein
MTSAWLTCSGALRSRRLRSWPRAERTENVLVVKATASAARQEQERIDEGKRAAERQQPEPPPEPPPEEGTVPEWVNPRHPFVPNAFGSAPHSASMPAGPMGEKVVYVTDDIEADGTPLIEGAAGGCGRARAEPQRLHEFPLH